MAYSTALEEEEEAGWQCCMPRRGAVLGADPRPGGCRRRPQPGQPAPPAEAGRSPLGHSHEESSWCSWRPLEWRARAEGGGGGVLLAPHRAPSGRTGVVTEGWPAQGLSRGRSAPSAVSRSCSRVTNRGTLVSYVLGPPTEEASLLLELANIRFAACVPF